MKTIYAYKLVLTEESVKIICDQCDPALHAIFGRGNLKSEVELPMDTIQVLRKKLKIHPEVNTLFWLERTLRMDSGLENLLFQIRNQRLKYSFSAFAISGARQK